ncbi:MAG: AAA family ATPase [Oscillospiraceae bacterium]
MGNNNIKESLLGALTSGRLSHGLLIVGTKGLGVNHFARLLAGDIIGAKDISQIEEGKSPVVQTITGEGLSGQIKVEKIRQINDNVNFSSINGEKRVVIIENCENFNQNSANALLKNLEEPKDDITYILTTNDASAILPTIRSRCGVYTIFPPSYSEGVPYLEKISGDKGAIEALIKIYGMNIGKITMALKDEKRYAILQNAIEMFNVIKRKDTYELTKMCFAYNKKKDDFRLLLQDLTDIADKNITAESVNLLTTVQKYQSILKTNAGLNLIIENFALEAVK